VTGVVGIANGGTGSTTKSFVDLTTDQTIAGNKTFTGRLSGDGSGLSNISGASIAGSTALNPLRLAIRRWYDVNFATQPIAVGVSYSAWTPYCNSLKATKSSADRSGSDFFANWIHVTGGAQRSQGVKEVSPAGRPDPKRLSATQIFDRSAPRVVLLKTYDEKGNVIGQASGVLLSPNGYVATNAHVVVDCSALAASVSKSRSGDVQFAGLRLMYYNWLRSHFPRAKSSKRPQLQVQIVTLLFSNAITSVRSQLQIGLSLKGIRQQRSMAS